MKSQESREVKKPLFIMDLIRQIQNELIESQRQREQEGLPALFEVESLTVEAQFVITDSSKGKGGFDLKILTLGSETTYSSEQVHKITLTLKTTPHREGDFGLGSLDIEPSGRRPRR